MKIKRITGTILLIAGAILLVTGSTGWAIDLNQRSVEYETNPGTNRIEYEAATDNTGSFDLILTATEVFGGGVQKSSGKYQINTDGKWTEIRHTTTQGITFTIRLENGSQKNLRNGLAFRGNVIDGRGNAALEGKSPFEFEFLNRNSRISGSEPIMFDRERTTNNELQFQVRKTNGGAILQAVNPRTGALWWEKPVGEGDKINIEASQNGDLLAVISGEEPGTGRLPRIEENHNTLYILEGRTGKILGKMNPLSENPNTAWADKKWQDIQIRFTDTGVSLTGTLNNEEERGATGYRETVRLPDWEKR